MSNESIVAKGIRMRIVITRIHPPVRGDILFDFQAPRAYTVSKKGFSTAPDFDFRLIPQLFGENRQDPISSQANFPVLFRLCAIAIYFEDIFTFCSFSDFC